MIPADLEAAEEALELRDLRSRAAALSS